MKKFLTALGAAAGLLALAAIAGPGLIDWNAYKADIRAKVKKATGRDITLGGDINLRLLPVPEFSVSDVALANIAGGSGPQMVRLEGLAVKIAPAPLLKGEIRVTTMRLIRPVVLLERTSDGQVNWALETGGADGGAAAEAAPPPSSSTPSPSRTPPASAPEIAVDSFTIEDAEVIYADATTGLIEKITDMDARFAATGLKGPFESTGELTYKGVRISFGAGAAEMIHDRTVPVTLSLGIGADAQFKLDGSVVDLETAPKIRGKLTAAGKDLRNLIAELGGSVNLPAVLAQPFSMDGRIEGAAAAVKTRDMAVTLGGAKADMTLTAALNDVLSADVTLSMGRIDLDEWLEGASGSAASAPASAVSDDGPPIPARPASSSPASATTLQLPKGPRIGSTLKIASVTYREGDIRDVTISADLSDGEVVLNQVTAGLPGEADIAAFGILSTPGGVPTFDGEIEASAKRLRGLADWLGVEAPAGLPNDRLKTLQARASVTVSPSQAQISNLTVKLDKSTLSGGVTAKLGGRIGVGANLTLDALNLDPYLRAAKRAKRPAGQSGPGTAAGTNAAASAQGGTKTNPLTALKPLGAFDANVLAKIGSLTAHGITAKSIALDASLIGGDLTINGLSVGSAAGTKVDLAGSLLNLGGVPKAKNLRLRARAKSIAPLAKAFALQLPVTPGQIGAVETDTTLNGNPLTPKFRSAVKALGGRLLVFGQASPLSLAAGVKLNVDARHPNTADLLRRLGVAYKPQGKIGGFSLKTVASGKLDKPAFSDLEIKLNGTPLTGEISADLTGAVPVVKAHLRAGRLNLDPFLPAQQRADWGLTRRHAAVSKRWSRKSIDISGLNLLNADVTLTSPSLTVKNITLTDADLAATLNGGSLNLPRLKGNALGGSIDLRASVGDQFTSRAAGRFQNIDLGAASALFGQGGLLGRVSGDLRLDARGTTEAALISSLDGVINMAVRDMDVSELSRLGPAAPFAGVIQVLNAAGGALGGGKTGGGLADLTGTLRIRQGVVRPESLQFVSNIGEATAEGQIDLPAWTANIQGVVAPSPNILTALLTRNAGKLTQIPFSVAGPLENPTVNFDRNLLRSSGGGGTGIKEVDKLLGNSGTGRAIRGVLDGILGGVGR